MINKILLAYDTSEQSKKAFDFALDLASKYDASIRVLSVATPPEPSEIIETQAVIDAEKSYFETHFEDLQRRMPAGGPNVTFEIQLGHPAEQIVAVAEREEADMIVMGHRGKTLVERWLLGSVSKRVLSYAHCTVSIVR